jgi:hypothetical protein
LTGEAEKHAEHVATEPQATGRGRLRGQIWIVGLVLAGLLALPGKTITAKYVNDLFIFLDGAHRIWSGQVPNIDFHSSLGPLAFYLPAAGYGLSGSMGAAMPIGMGLLVLLFAAAASEIISSRLRPAVGLPLAVFLLLIAAAPANPGERVGELSFAMFYNRMGWVSLSLLLVMYLPRSAKSTGGGLADAFCAAFLVLLMLYTKVTYGLVELVFVIFMLCTRRVAWAALTLALVAGAAALIEIVWRGGAAHLADLRLAAEVSGGLPSPRALLDVITRNLADITVYAIFAAALLALRPGIRHGLFVGFCLSTGILIIEQNFQQVGILTLAASAAVIAELLMRAELASRYRRLAAGLPLLLTVLILPPTVSNAATLVLHAFYAVSDKGSAIPLREFSAIRLVPMWSGSQYNSFRRYSETLADGQAALLSLGKPEQVVVLDFVNPFSAGMRIPPPVHDSAWYHWGRTIDRQHRPAAEDILSSAALIMDPKWPIEVWTASGLRAVYAAYIESHYDLIRETEYWRIYRRRPGPA